MKTAANLIAERLFEAGCRHAFGIPGGEVLTLMDAMRNAGIEFILVKHENAGGFMAEGTHHFTKAPCILLATIGPGVANAVNVVANCLQDQVPLIFLTGCIDPQIKATFTHQVFDHGELLKSITKASFSIVDGTADILIDKAISVALDGKPGPVHVDVPISVSNRSQDFALKTRRVKPAMMLPAPSTELRRCRDLFTNAIRPLIIAGVDVLHHDAAQAVVNTIEKHKHVDAI